MTTTVRRGLASLIFGTLVLAIAGCGGGGGGLGAPTATPIGTRDPNATATPVAVATATSVPGTGGTTITTNQIAFVSNRNGMTDLYKSNSDGSGVVRLTNRSQTIDKPSVSPDGNRLVFQIGDSNTTGGENNIEIASINVNGSDFRQLTNDTVPLRPDDYNPVYSLNGSSIYWTSTRQTTDEKGQLVDRVPHIWRMDSTGENQAVLVHEASAYPSIDKNGDLAYLALNQTTNPIAIANATTGTVTKRIGDSAAGNSIFDLALSPDGTRVAYSVGSGTTSASIHIFNVSTGASEATIGASGTSVGGAAWSRNSQTLYYDAAGGATIRREIFYSPAPFTTQTELTPNGSGDNYSPAFVSG